tara:strand:+ start:1435 stop:1656 length:222 start_codon:yes stop_codon:yes gene_type:complete
MEDKIFWLDGFEGKAKGGAYYRSKTAIDIAEFEEKFGKKVVALGMEKDYETGKPSWNLHMITEEQPEGETTDE